MTFPGAPIYDRPVRADHAHTKKRSGPSSEALPITINTLLDNGSSETRSADTLCSFTIGLGGSTVLLHN